MLVWNPFGIGGVLAMMLSFVLAGLVLRHGRGRRQSRLLAFLLIAEGTWTGTAAGALYLMEHEQAALGMQLIGTFAANTTVIAYLLFAGTLATPLRRVLGASWFQATALAILVVQLVDLVRRPGDVVLYMYRPPYALWEARAGDTGLVLDAFPIVLVTGLLLASWAWLRTPRNTSMRVRAGTIALAFLVRDVLWLILFVPVLSRATADPPNVWLEVYVQGHGVATGLFAALLAYGILRHQVLDIDLKLKVAIERSTLISIFAGIVFVLSELVEQVMAVDQVLPAVLVAGGVTLAFRPLQQAAARFADIAMPGVEDTPAYRAERAREVYAAALDSARVDGKVTDQERAVLSTLAAQLGLSAEEASAMEGRGEAAVPAPAPA